MQTGNTSDDVNSSGLINERRKHFFSYQSFCRCSVQHEGTVCHTTPSILPLMVNIHGCMQALKGYKSHSNIISDLAWSPHSEHVLLTGSHDHTVRMWDVRSSIPLATLEHHTDKVLSVGWASRNVLLSGGADAKLHIYATVSAEE